MYLFTLKKNNILPDPPPWQTRQALAGLPPLGRPQAKRALHPYTPLPGIAGKNVLKQVFMTTVHTAEMKTLTNFLLIIFIKK